MPRCSELVCIHLLTYEYMYVSKQICVHIKEFVLYVWEGKMEGGE